jgi:hypothetical protein
VSAARAAGETGNAGVPGQAALLAYERALGGQTGSWKYLGPAGHAAWEAAAQAAIDAFLAGDSVSAESIREAIAAREAQPAPGPAFDAIVAPDGLEFIRADLHDGLLDAVLKNADEDLNGFDGTREQEAERYVRWLESERERLITEADLAAQEQPAPELAAVLADRHDLSALNAWQGAEIGRLREQLDATKTVLQETSRESSQRGEQLRLVREGIVKLVYDLEASSQQTSPSKKTEIERGIIRKLQAILEGK